MRGELKGEFYSDVLTALAQWTAAGTKVTSSHIVTAQQAKVTVGVRYAALACMSREPQTKSNPNAEFPSWEDIPCFPKFCGL